MEGPNQRDEVRKINPHPRTRLPVEVVINNQNNNNGKNNKNKKLVT